MQEQETTSQAVQDTLGSLAQLDSIAWIDWTAMVLLAVFFILGLFKGFVWQVSRIATLVAAWFLAGHYGPQGAELCGGWFDPAATPAELPLFLSYAILFILAVVLLSLVAWLLQKLVKESGLTSADRLGGAFLGLCTGGVGVVVLLAGLLMLLPNDFAIVQAATRSHSMRFSQQALKLMGDTVPEPVQRVFKVDEKPAAPAVPAAPAEPK